MSNISINFILGWCGILVAAQRNRITSDLLIAPEVLGHFYNESTEELMSNSKTMDIGMWLMTRYYSPEYNRKY